jgi:hypothetical protein
MEAFIHSKGDTIQNLLNVTSSLLNEIDSGNLDQIDYGLSERARLFSQLVQLDKDSSAKATELDEKWMQQLQSLKEMDAVLMQKLENQLNDTKRAMRVENQAKENLLRTEMVDRKGSSFNAKM